ncbi:hypothetical protein [Enterovirga sp. CN4-39]|uniref:hypothetical protein n=1 Tax=Enterovirga sp. CN4-39 TaxID=3400910 RepID=UPI003C0DB031
MSERSMILSFVQALSRSEGPLLASFRNAPDFQRLLLGEPENLVPRMAEAGPSGRARAKHRAASASSKPSLD